jgi:hypothetical protein
MSEPIGTNQSVTFNQIRRDPDIVSSQSDVSDYLDDEEVMIIEDGDDFDGGSEMSSDDEVGILNEDNEGSEQVDELEQVEEGEGKSGGVWARTRSNITSGGQSDSRGRPMGTSPASSSQGGLRRSRGPIQGCRM